MIQLEQQQHREFVGGGVVVWWWLTPTTYIQLAGAGSKCGTAKNKEILTGTVMVNKKLLNCLVNTNIWAITVMVSNLFYKICILF